MAPDACAATPRAPHGWLHVQDTCRTPPLLPDVRDTSCSVDPPRAFLHVRLHVQLPCTATPRASGDTQLAGQLTPRSEHSHQATSCFSVHSSDFGPSASGFLEEFHNTEIRVFVQLRVFPSCFDPVVLASRSA
ncbi:hypothetical protein F2Q70_00023605 [Brassica cretica]|uniref:Uncharacterized protein n=1 Tax=Brassica cretica TaxID=69181 RepID=A0A8S9GSY9_BRACR|nr:hypothetical protein F2Q70_00023605 [Brassica cretica]KAF2558376.1 hypothetical protein F2Q68_00017931 [Brassica cretica]